MKETAYNLDFVPGGAVPVVHCAQGDIGRPIRFKFFWGANEYAPTATTASISVLKPDGNAAVITATVSGAEAAWKTTEQSTVLSGKLPCVLSIVENSEIVHSSKFLMNVQRDPCADASPSESDLGTWQTIANHIIEASAKASAAEAWAVGTVDGVAVPESATQYKNNAKYYAEGQKKHAAGRIVTVTDAANFPPEKIALYGQSTQSGTPTVDSPAPILPERGNTAENMPIIQVFGKNLSPVNGIEAVWAKTSSDMLAALNRLPIGTYTVSYSVELTANTYGNKTMKSTDTFGILLSNYVSSAGSHTSNHWDATQIGTIRASSFPLEITSKNMGQYKAAYFYGAGNASNGGTGIGRFFNIQIEAGTAATDFEPYQCQQVELQDWCNGIPVTSGGNYTDKNGQQWICDTVEKDSGGDWFYTQRICSLEVDGSSDENWKRDSYFYLILSDAASSTVHEVLCTFANYKYSDSSDGAYVTSSRFMIGNSSTAATEYKTVDAWRAFLAENPQRILYVLRSPVKHPIPEEISQAIEALNMLKPVTTITAGGAVVNVDYLPDAYVFDKLHIMNARIDALEARVAALEG